MKQLILVGAGSWGLEVHSWFEHQDVIGCDTQWQFKGFLDDNEVVFENLPTYQPLFLSTIDNYQPTENDVFVCTIADPVIKEKIVTKLEEKKAEFITLKHRTALFYGDSPIGKGCIFAANSLISIQIIIGDHVGVNVGCSLGHNVEIGDYSQLSSQVNLAGFVKIGKKVSIGSSACFIPQAMAEDSSIIGAGSVVLKKAKTGTTVFGNPAKVIFTS